jgi:tetratricopeptide (TPR) repeat protein
MERVLALPGAEKSEQYTWCLAIAGEFPRFQGDFKRARELKEMALARSRQAGNTLRVAAILHDLGSIAEGQGDLGRARVLHEEALAIRRAQGEPGGISHALNGLTTLALREGDYVLAETLATEELALWLQVKNPDGASSALHSLGESLRKQGKLARAARSYQESMSIVGADVIIVAESLDGLADVAAALGDTVAATQLWSASRRLFDDSTLQAGDPGETEDGMARARSTLGTEVFEETWRAGRAMDRDAAIVVAGRVAAAAQTAVQ